MPNWCKNRLSVVGRDIIVDAFVARAEGTCQMYPPQLYSTDSEEAREAQLQSAWKAVARRTAFSFQQLCPLPVEVMSNEYSSAGYEAEAEAWGIKWGCNDAKLERVVQLQPRIHLVEYTYQTPWAPGQRFWERVAPCWPELQFFLSWGEEYPSRGRLCAQNGHLTVVTNESWTDRVESDVMADYDAAADDDGERRHDLSDAWRDEYLRSHGDWVAQYLKAHNLAALADAGIVAGKPTTRG